MKNLVIVDELGRIVFLSETVEGKRHDKQLATDCDFQIKESCEMLADLGFQGWKLPENVKLIMPNKKPRGKELSAEKKAENKVISGVRVHVEHAIGGAKRMRIIKDIARSHSYFRKDLFIQTAVALHNFRRSKRMCALSNAKYVA